MHPVVVPVLHYAVLEPAKLNRIAQLQWVALLLALLSLEAAHHQVWRILLQPSHILLRAVIGELLNLMIDAKLPQEGMPGECAYLPDILLLCPFELFIFYSPLRTLLVLEEQTAGINMIVLLVEAFAFVVEQPVGVLVPSHDLHFDA